MQDTEGQQIWHQCTIMEADQLIILSDSTKHWWCCCSRSEENFDTSTNFGVHADILSIFSKYLGPLNGNIFTFQSNERNLSTMLVDDAWRHLLIVWHQWLSWHEWKWQTWNCWMWLGDMQATKQKKTQKLSTAQFKFWFSRLLANRSCCWQCSTHIFLQLPRHSMCSTHSY